MSQSGIYSELKPARWWVADGNKWPDAPKQVQLILSSLCSHDCRWCAYRLSDYTSNQLFTVGAELSKFGHENPVRFMDTERAMKFLDDFKELGVLGVQYTGAGESTMHKDHEMIYRRTLELGLHGALVSNGDSWGPHLATEILPQFDWVRVSIDAGTPETYASIRGINPKRWDRVWGHVRQLAESIKQAGSKTTLGIGFVVGTDSWQEIPECCRIAKEAGAVYVRLSAIFSPEDEKPYIPIYDDIVKVIGEAKQKYNDDSFTVHDNFGSRVADLKLGNPTYKTCGYMRYTTYLADDLNNYMCCVYAYNKRGLMGNLKDQSFAEWWRSTERQEFMDKFDARACVRCQFNERNQQLNYIRGDSQSIAMNHMEWP